MKKIISTIAVSVILVSGLLLTSCNSNSRLCPAYPPSVYQGDAGHQSDMNQDIKDLNINEKL